MSEQKLTTQTLTREESRNVHREYLNRDISWLEFNRRVLEEAADERNPLLERVKFLAIFSSNLDEFFMKRMGRLKRKLLHNSPERSLDGLTCPEQFTQIRRKVSELTQQQETYWEAHLKPALNQEKIFLHKYDQLTPQQKTKADEYFRKEVFPVLTPLAVDPGHPFPFISNLSVSVGVLLRQPGQTETLFARVKVPQLFSRWLSFFEGGEAIFLPLESLIEARLHLLFPGMEILESRPFRVTRNAEVELDTEDSEDLLEVVQGELRARRFADTVRLQIPRQMSAEMRTTLLEGLEIKEEDTYILPEPLGMVDLMAVAAMDRPQLKATPWKPVCPPTLVDPDSDIFAMIRQRDILLHHPYESFETSVERFILSAVQDPKVLAIKMTLYRTSGDSPFVTALARAAEEGKQVAVLVELKARFDEASNIRWAQALESSGAHVVYGVMGLKTHTKTALVVRREEDGLRCYAHVATGNYNSKTAQLYTDLGLLTCRPDVCEDILELFAYLTGRSLKRSYHKLLVAPVTMRKRFLELIDREAQKARSGGPGRIIAKMNALEDAETIQALYRASQAGVEIDLIVRGFCCLRPGVPGLSEHIRVQSVIGRFLEHSRIFLFGQNAQEDIFLGSADWMSRNLSFRVEAAVPVEDPGHKAHLRELLEMMLQDNRQAWDLAHDGSWKQRRPGSGEPDLGTHARLMAQTLQRSEAALGRDR